MVFSVVFCAALMGRPNKKPRSCSSFSHAQCTSEDGVLCWPRGGRAKKQSNKSVCLIRKPLNKSQGTILMRKQSAPVQCLHHSSIAYRVAPTRVDVGPVANRNMKHLENRLYVCMMRATLFARPRSPARPPSVRRTSTARPAARSAAGIVRLR